MILAEDVKQVVDIVELIGKYTELRKSGRSWRSACPLHTGQDLNFAVYPETQSFHCYVCGKGGDVFDFLGFAEGLSFREAFRKLAAANGLDVETGGTHLDAPPALKLASAEARAFDRWAWLKRRHLIAKLEAVEDHEAATHTFAEVCFKSPHRIPEAHRETIHENLNYAHEAREVLEQQLDKIDLEPLGFLDAFLREFYGSKSTRELVA